MILYFANRKMEILGHATTDLPEGFIVIEDLKTEEIDMGVVTFSCRFGYDEKTRSTLEEMTEVGNYLLRSNGDENEFYTIIEAEIDTKNQEIYIYAEDAGLDLLNEIATEFEATEAHSAEWYVNKYIVDSGFEIGINEIPASRTRTLSWDGDSTVTERLASIATQFGGFEISYSFAINGMEITNKYINLYEKRGKDVSEQLRLNRDIDRIIIKKSIANLATALRCTGGTPDGKDKPITLRGYEYDDGDIFISNGVLYSRSAVEKWSRYQWEKGTAGYRGHIIRTFSYDTTSQKTLCTHAITELKKICEMEVNYEVEISKLPENIKVGDRINIVDDKGELYLSARILVLETSITEQQQTATLGEYLIKDSGISAQVEELAEQFVSGAGKRSFYTWIAYADDSIGTGISLEPAGKAYLGTAVNKTVEDVDISDPSIFTWAKIQGNDGVSGEDAITLRIDSSRGTVFKNSAVSTILSAVIYKGAKRITDSATLKEELGSSAYLQWSWQKLGEDTFGTILSTDERLRNDGFSFVLSPEDVSTKVVFQCQLITD